MVKVITSIFHSQVSFKNRSHQWFFKKPLILFITLIISSQTIASTSITNLAKVKSITQDNKGFIWLSTQQGLIRYDGNNSIDFSHSNTKWQTPYSWTHNINKVGEDFIVSSESNGVWLFNPSTGKNTKIEVPNLDGAIYDAIEFKGSYLIYNYKAKNEKIIQFNPDNGISTVVNEKIKIKRFLKSEQNLFMFSVKLGLFKFENSSFTHILKEPINISVAVKNGVVAIGKNTLYFIHDNGSMISTPLTESIHGLTKDFHSNNVYTISDSGKVRYFETESLRELPHNYANAKKVIAKTIYHDSSGVLWAASNLGVQRLMESAIVNYPIDFGLKINANEITFYENELVIGTFGKGIKKFNTKKSLVDESINQILSKNALRISDIITINDKIYIGTFDGVWLYSPKENKMERLDFPKNNKLILKLKYDESEQHLYITTSYNGLYIYDTAEKIIIEHIDKSHGLSHQETIDAMPLDDGNIWLATKTGIDIYNRYSKVMKNITTGGPNKVISLAFKNNKIFAITMGDGIFVYNRKGELLSLFGEGITFNYSAIIEDNIWVSSSQGLYHINPDNHQLTLEPGTETYTFSGEPHAKNNKVFAAHFGGILAIPLVKQADYDAKVYISKTMVSGESSLHNKSIHIESSNDVVTLELASLDYRPGKEKQYKYKINNGTWNNISGNQLTLTGLASGNYDIEIMATNSIGQWSTHKAYTDISVAYPWYWTPQIRILYFVTFLCAIALGIWLLYLRTKSISHIYQLLEADIKSRGKSALTVSRNISLSLELLEKGNDEAQTKQLLQQCLEELRETNSGKEPNSLFGNSLAVALPYFADFLHQKYHINLSSRIEVDEDSLSYELQSNIYRIIYEAVTSAILSGDGRNFEVSMQKFKNKMWLTISDEEGSFIHFTNKINFNMAMYYIRQIAMKYDATVNTFEHATNGSQLTISFPLLEATVES